MSVRIAVHGACGRMGQRVVHAIEADPDCTLSAAIDSPNHPQAGRDIGEICGLGNKNIPVSSTLPENVDVVIDFSIPDASIALGRLCEKRRLPLVVATTGFEPSQKEELERVARSIPMIVASNYSLVVNLLWKLTEEVGRALAGRDFDVEIIEQHHRHKVDSPSGTALRFAQVLEETMGLSLRRHGREGIVGERPRHELGLHAVRAGDNTGQHTIIFSTPGETLELVHRSTSRDSYATGAVSAAKFLIGKPPGEYSMNDVLGLE